MFCHEATLDRNTHCTCPRCHQECSGQQVAMISNCGHIFHRDCFLGLFDLPNELFCPVPTCGRSIRISRQSFLEMFDSVIEDDSDSESAEQTSNEKRGRNLERTNQERHRSRSRDRDQGADQTSRERRSR